MKTQLMLLGLLAVGASICFAPIKKHATEAEAPSYQTVDCSQERQPCKRWDGSDGVCTLQYCATTKNPHNTCFVCAEPEVSTSQEASAIPS